MLDKIWIYISVFVWSKEINNWGFGPGIVLSSEFEYEYQLGIFVKLGRTAEETIFQYFKNGQEVLENDF